MNTLLLDLDLSIGTESGRALLKNVAVHIYSFSMCSLNIIGKVVCRVGRILLWSF